MSHLIRVKNETLMKDPNSGAFVETDFKEYENFKKRKAQQLKILELEKRINNIDEKLNLILEKLK